jgi:hypothetical protein
VYDSGACERESIEIVSGIDNLFLKCVMMYFKLFDDNIFYLELKILLYTQRSNL